MAQQKNLPISEPGLIGVSQPVTVGDPTGLFTIPNEPQSMQRRLWVLYPFVSLSISMISGAINGVLLGRIIATYSDVPKVSQAGVLGLTLSISGIFYLVAGPLGGLASDKTRTRFLGRRNLWILIGGIAAAASILVLGLSPNIPVLIVMASFNTLFVGLILASSSAIVPERVPIRRRGRISSINSLMAVIGSGVGTEIGALTPNLFTAFVILAVQVVVFCALFAFLTKDQPAPTRVDKTDLSVVRAKFPTPHSHPDYWLTFLARGLAFVAYGMATGLQLYALRDWFKVGDGSLGAAQTALGAIIPFSTLALVVAALAGGILVDRFGRLKPFVVLASVLFIPAALVLTLVPSYVGAFVGLVITGLAFGAYISVDGVLMTRVIPSKTNAGRDLGILNVSGGVGSIVSTALAGALAASTGYGLVFILVIAAGALASFAVLFIRSVR